MNAHAEIRSVDAQADNDGLMTSEETAAYLRLSVPALHQMRSRGRGPRAIRVGRRLLFRRGDLVTWAQSRYEEDVPPAAPPSSPRVRVRGLERQTNRRPRA